MVELYITLREGGEEREEKIKLGVDGSPVTVDQITNRLYKYQVKKNAEVIDMRARVVRVEEHVFTLNDDGDFLVNGLPISGDEILDEQQVEDHPVPVAPRPKPVPAMVVEAPPLRIIDPPDSRIKTVIDGNIAHLTEEQQQLIEEAKIARTMSAERDPYVKKGLVMATPQDVMEYAPESAEQMLMGQIGGGRKEKKIHAGTPLAGYASEYYLFEPLPRERQNGITTIGYPRNPTFFKYQPPYRAEEFALLFPKNTGVRALSFAVRGGSRMWEITDGRKIASVPEVHLVSAPTGPGLEPDLFDQLDYAPDTKPTFSRQQFAAMMKAQEQNGSGGQPQNVKVDLEVLDDAPKNNQVYKPKGPVTAREIQRSIEQQAINQVEKMDPSRNRKKIIVTQ